MTDTPAPMPGEEAVAQWLAAQQDDLTDGLAPFLDVEAGLHEVEVYACHNDLVHGLGQVLDVEAGLAAILPSPAFPPGSATTNDCDAAGHMPIRTVDDITPRMRLTLRSHPVTMLSIFGGFLTRVVELTRALDHAPNLGHAYDRPINNVLALDLHSALTRVRNRARALDLDLAQDLDRVLRSGFEEDLYMALTSDRERGRERDLGVASARARKLARDLALVLRDALTRERGYVYRDSVRDHALDRVLDCARTRDRDLATDLAVALHDALDHDLDRARDCALALSHCLDRTVSSSLGLEGTEGLSGALLEGVLDDFTGADLRGLGLTDLHLVGMRWSSGTRWPQHIDREWLSRRSRETPPGSGIFTVLRPRPGSGGVRGGSPVPVW
ncbi:hypothetical protein [Streptomyces sp. NBC_00147]|uniref:hypothetical protein n=1 Tax=Streptomyces sp. NBC_00147 TaxID=2975667 RepID=UPI0032529BFB